MLKEYKKSETIVDGEGKTDYFNTNVLVTAYPDAEGNQTTELWEYPLFNDGFINKDLVDLPSDQVTNVMIAPDETFIGNQEKSLYGPSQASKTVIMRYFKNVTPEMKVKTPAYSYKENFIFERNGIEIMQNVIRRVTEVQQLDNARVPLLTDIVDAIIEAFQAVAGYQDPNIVNTPSLMNLALTPDLIQAISDATQEFSNKDEEMRTLLDELSQEVQTFINDTQE